MEKTKLVGTNSKSRVDPYSTKTLNQATRYEGGNVSYMGLEKGNDGERDSLERQDGAETSDCLKRIFALYGKSIVFGGIDGLLLGMSTRALHLQKLVSNLLLAAVSSSVNLLRLSRRRAVLRRSSNPRGVMHCGRGA